MKDLSKQFGFVSLLFLVIMAVSPVKEHFRQWRQMQRSYNKYIEILPQRLSPVKKGLKQIWIPDLGVIDRCSTCHLGSTEPALKDAPVPFATHPEIYHQPEEFGCTPCHQGQGLATDMKSAGGKVEFWEEPILSRPFIESSCGTCHQEDLNNQAPLLNEGLELIEEYNCAGCHEIKGLDKEFAPRLDGLGSKVNRQWLVRWLTEPAKVVASTLMPDFRLTEEEINLLADFLLTFKEYPTPVELEPLPEVLRQEEILDELYEPGETLFRTARCISCHLVNGKGGSVAPEIGTIASKASLEWIYNFLRNPHALQPGTPMAQYSFSDEELQSVTAYIAMELVDWDAPEQTDDSTDQPDPNYYEKGLKLFQNYNCGGCHSLSGIALGEQTGPSLSNMRKKPLYQLEFGLKDIPHTREHYVYEKIKNPGGFLDNALMPTFTFDEQEIMAITTALLSFQELPVHEKFRVKEPRARLGEPQGEFGMLVSKYRCLTCHRINGRGGTMAPDISRAGSQLTHAWIENYFRLPYTLRPIMTERMPNFYMHEEEIEILSDYISMVLRDDALEVNSELEFSVAEIESGRKLYFNTYGCQACHQIGGEGGYVGPPLDNLAQRLQPGWVYQRLKNPRRFNPDVLEPNFDLSDDEARALTAFLLTTKGD
ncbi:MAG: c-type cytochrome [Candidatus Glassbacteria bacterium]|nr:c-type cytochrome [Candidatus Glassbacteria bacterium]